MQYSQLIYYFNIINMETVIVISVLAALGMFTVILFIEKRRSQVIAMVKSK